MKTLKYRTDFIMGKIEKKTQENAKALSWSELTVLRRLKGRCILTQEIKARETGLSMKSLFS